MCQDILELKRAIVPADQNEKKRCHRYSPYSMNFHYAYYFLSYPSLPKPEKLHFKSSTEQFRLTTKHSNPG
jgi:hypothetical protein